MWEVVVLPLPEPSRSFLAAHVGAESVSHGASGVAELRARPPTAHQARDKPAGRDVSHAGSAAAVRPPPHTLPVSGFVHSNITNA
jgi:hypothetical protein